MRFLGVLGLGLAVVSTAGAAPVLTVRVQGSATRTSAPGCVFSIRAAIAGGGRQLTCLTSVRG